MDILEFSILKKNKEKERDRDSPFRPQQSNEAKQAEQA